MSELKGGIERGASTEDVDQSIDPELVDDREVKEPVPEAIDIPEYDESQFELPVDFEYQEDDE